MYYRYEFINKCKYPHTGIIGGLLEVFEGNEDLQMDLVSPFEDELEFPDPKKINAQTPSELSDARCFFTEKGNEKFKPYIDNIIDEAYKVGGIAICVSLDEESNPYKIVYEDEYQVMLAIQ